MAEEELAAAWGGGAFEEGANAGSLGVPARHRAVLWASRPAQPDRQVFVNDDHLPNPAGSVVRSGFTDRAADRLR